MLLMPSKLVLELGTAVDVIAAAAMPGPDVVAVSSVATRPWWNLAGLLRPWVVGAW
jgi:hypothetical protein